MADGTGTDGLVIQDFGGHLIIVHRESYANGGATRENQLGDVRQWVRQGQSIGWTARYWDKADPLHWLIHTHQFTNKEDALSWLLVMIRMG